MFVSPADLIGSGGVFLTVEGASNPFLDDCSNFVLIGDKNLMRFMNELFFNQSRLYYLMENPEEDYYYGPGFISEVFLSHNLNVMRVEHIANCNYSKTHLGSGRILDTYLFFQ